MTQFFKPFYHSFGLLAMAWAANSAAAQTLQPILTDQTPSQTFIASPQDPSGYLDISLAAAEESSAYQLSGRFHLQAGTNQGYLVVQCELPAGNHIYSLTQTGGPKPTIITVRQSPEFKTTGQFHPDSSPIVTEDDPVFHERIEKHDGTVRFFIPLEVSPSVDVNKLQPEMVVDGLVCSDDGFCIPVSNQTVKATFAGYFERSSQRQQPLQESRK